MMLWRIHGHFWNHESESSGCAESPTRGRRNYHWSSWLPYCRWYFRRIQRGFSAFAWSNRWYSLIIQSDAIAEIDIKSSWYGLEIINLYFSQKLPFQWVLVLGRRKCPMPYPWRCWWYLLRFGTIALKKKFIFDFFIIFFFPKLGLWAWFIQNQICGRTLWRPEWRNISVFIW